MPKIFEVGLPADETWWFEVEAENAEEALEIARKGFYENGDQIVMTHTTGGSQTLVRNVERPKNWIK